MLHPPERPLYVADILAGRATFPFPPMPSARVDAIGLESALDIITNLAPPPRVHQTLVITVDHERRGVSITAIAGTDDPDAILAVADEIAAAAVNDPGLGGVVIATFRPGGSDQLDDVERWLTIDEELAVVGVDLIEWFVIGGAVSRPRVLLGEPSRWEA